jgi:ABC-type polysaccharide/polyol phosphate transport system ATPase subunit
MDPIICLESASKRFRKGDGRAPLISLVRGALGYRGESASYCSLQDINLRIERGDKVGLIGSNGAGKTTLLKIIAGLYPPSSGKVEVHGTVSFLAGFGTGMLDELTVIENATLYSAIYGVERNMLEENLDEILAWAGLEEFRHTLFKHLSAGMKVRLAFSTYRYFHADVFLMDEALSAGDQVFQKKSHDILLKQKFSERTMVIASHNSPFIENFCNKVIWLEQGQLQAFGTPEEVVASYSGISATEESTAEQQHLTTGN